LLKNVRKGIPDALRDEMKTARKEGMEKIRSHYVIALDIANRFGTPEMVEKCA
jgi:hypothetical protein